MSKRTFVALCDGQAFEIPTTMRMLRQAEKLSDTSLMEALSENKTGAIVQALIAIVKYGMVDRDRTTGGMKKVLNELELLRRKEQDNEAYEEVGEICDFAEAQHNYLAFMQALIPETASKNESAEEPTKTTSPGEKSKDTPTDSSN